MVRILEPNYRQSFSDRLLRGISQAGQGLTNSLAAYQKAEEGKAKEKKSRLKSLASEAKPYLKSFHESIAQNEGSYNRFLDAAEKYSDEGYSNREAFQLAAKDLKKAREDAGGALPGEAPKLGRGPKEDKFIGGGLGRFLDSTKGLQKTEGRPLEKFAEFNKSLGRSVVEHGKDIAKHPGKALAEVPLAIGNVLNMPIDLIEAGLRKGGLIGPETDSNLLRQGLGKIQNWIREGKSPEEIEREAKREVAYGFIPIGKIFQGLNWLGGKLFGGKGTPGGIGGAAESAAKATENLRMRQNAKLSEGIFENVFEAPKKQARAAEAARTASAQKAKAAADRAGFAQRFSSEEPVGSTGARVERAAPSGKIFKPVEQANIREQQLKIHPQYAEEIAQDAAERVARAEAKAPKTAVGEAGVANRMAAGRAALPKAQEAYQRSVARVRALENQISQGAPAAAQAELEAVYESAVKELNEAEFHLKNTINNAMTGEARVGFEEMRQAARNKMIRIADEISEGKEVVLPKRDYNPEFIKKAKQLSKKKPLPSTRHDDYFTQVHEGYANEYRGQIARLDKEIEDLKNSTTLGGLQKGRQLQREREALQKLVDHVEAENTIHRHKMALREIQQRKVAQERLGKFTKQPGNEKIMNLAKEAIQSPQKAAEATEEVFAEAAAQSKDAKLREKILKEREYYRKRMEDIAKGEEKVSKSAKEVSEGATNAKEVKEKASRFARDWSELLQSLKNKGEGFFKTRIGKDFVWGVGAELLTQATKGEDLPITPSTLVALLGGRSGGVYRYAFSRATRWLFDQSRKSEYKRALREGDDEKLIELRDKLSPKLRKKAIEEFKQELSA